MKHNHPRTAARVAAFLALCLLMLGAVGCGSAPAPSEPTAQIANPFHNFDTWEEAQESAGVSMPIPEAVGAYPCTQYRSMPGKLLEVIYEQEPEYIRLRKALGDEDISGNYSAEVYELDERPVGDVVVITESKDGTLYNASWLYDGASYALSATAGIAPEELDALVRVVCQLD